MTIAAEDRELPREDRSAQKTHCTTCYMCACRCGIKVTTQHGKVRFIQGNPDHPVNQGVLCAKGSAGIMKQNSPAKLRGPLLRKPGSARGAGEFSEIGWDEALDLLTARLTRIRVDQPDPARLLHRPRPDAGAVRAVGAAVRHAELVGARRLLLGEHGGRGPVLDRLLVLGIRHAGFRPARSIFVLWGVAEDHSSNPIKIGLDKLKRRGAKFVSINPVRTGYSAIADEWIPMRPGSDGLLALAIVHVLPGRRRRSTSRSCRATPTRRGSSCRRRERRRTACSPATPAAIRWCTTRRRRRSPMPPAPTCVPRCSARGRFPTAAR